jgi:hypothetical protein
MITQTDRLLEHPEVLIWRRLLESQIDAGNVISYSNLRWSVRWGVTYLYIPIHPLQFLINKVTSQPSGFHV